MKKLMMHPFSALMVVVGLVLSILQAKGIEIQTPSESETETVTLTEQSECEKEGAASESTAVVITVPSCEATEPAEPDEPCQPDSADEPCLPESPDEENTDTRTDGPQVTTPEEEKPQGSTSEQITTEEAAPQGSTPAETETPSTDAPTETPEEETSAVLAYEREVVALVNEIRRAEGLNELTLNEKLCAVAREKSADMQRNGYFSHTSPTYGSPFDMMKSFGITYRTAGENIAMGYPTPAEVVDGWMNSEGHRANILNASFTEIGVGYVENGHYWTQMFIG